MAVTQLKLLVVSRDGIMNIRVRGLDPVDKYTFSLKQMIWIKAMCITKPSEVALSKTLKFIQISALQLTLTSHVRRDGWSWMFIICSVVRFI